MDCPIVTFAMFSHLDIIATSIPSTPSIIPVVWLSKESVQNFNAMATAIGETLLSVGDKYYTSYPGTLSDLHDTFPSLPAGLYVTYDKGISQDEYDEKVRAGLQVVSSNNGQDYQNVLDWLHKLQQQ